MRTSHLLPDGSIPVLVSAATPDLLRGDAAALLDYLDARPEVTPAAVADMLLRTRPARRYRALAVVRDRVTLRAALAAVAAGADHPAVVAAAPARARRSAFVFPGQGSQRPGMGALYYERSPAFRAEADRCETVFQELFGWSPLPYLLDESLPDTADVSVVQPALFVQMAGLAAMWTAAGVRPAAVVGHSQGEIAAAYLSGAMSLRDAVRVVTARARMVETLGLQGYSMAVLGVDRDMCEELLARQSGWAELSVINSAHIIAISGERDTVLDVMAAVSRIGGFAKEIRVAYPAHTSVVCRFRAELVAALGGTLDSAVFRKTEIACLGATLGGPVTTDVSLVDYWYWNLRNLVRFDRAVAAAVADGVDLFLEIAEHPTLLLALQENLSGSAVDAQVLGTSRRTATDLAEFARALAAVAVADLNYDWSALCHGTPDAPAPLPLRDFPPARMHAMRLWAEPEPGPHPAPATGGGAPPRQLTERWEPLPQRTLRPPRTLLLMDPSGACADLAAAVRDAAAGYGASAELFDGDYDTPRPGPVSVVLLLPPLPGLDAPAAVAALAAFLPTGARLPAPGPDTDYWIVATAAEPVVGDDVPQLVPAALAAALRAVAAERPGTAVRQLDLADGADPTECGAAVVAAVHCVGEPSLAVRGGTVYTKRLVPGATTDTPPNLRHVVITGGTGAVGLEFGARLARLGAGRITLLSRTGGAPERVAALRALGDTEFVVATVDVADPHAVAWWAAGQAEPATLVVHAAAGYLAAESTTVTADAVESACAAKVLGAAHLLEQLPRTPDCRVLFCSSASASFPARGQLLYAAANRMLDALAHRFRRAGIDCRSVQWGLWQAQGLLDPAGLARVRGTGAEPLDPVAAVDAGLRVPAGTTLLLAADWQALRAVLELGGQQRLLADAVLPAPAVPAAAPAPPRASTGEPAAVIRRELASVMGMADAGLLDGATPLVALGLDSLQALDFRKRIETTLGRDLPVAAVLGGASLDEVVRLVGNEERVG